MLDPVIVAATTFAFTVLGTAMTTTWRIGRMLDVRDKNFLHLMNEHEIADVNRFADVRQRMIEGNETLRHEFGETGNALRQHMHEMEMWGRDNNLQKNSFDKAVETITASIGGLSEKIDRSISRRIGT